jgi:hypothetical protein
MRRMRKLRGPLVLLVIAVALVWFAGLTGRGALLFVAVPAAVLLTVAGVAVLRGSLSSGQPASVSRSSERPGITFYPAMPPDPRRDVDDEKRGQR